MSKFAHGDHSGLRPGVDVKALEVAGQIASHSTGSAAFSTDSREAVGSSHLFPSIAASVRWPPGTTFFAFRTWAALALGFFLAFLLELNAGGGVGVSILILVAPAQGMVLSKAIYRVLGTLGGAVAAVFFTALFPQDRTMLIASFAVYMGLLVACGTLLRDFRAYGCILAGYTVAQISIVRIDAPTTVFPSTLDRVAVILLGVLSIALANALIATQESTRSLTSKMRVASSEVMAMALAALDARAPPDASHCIAMSAKLMPLRSEISFATPELPGGRARARGGRSALLGLLEMLSAIQAVGLSLRQFGGHSPFVEEAVSITRIAIRLQRPETQLSAMDAISLGAIETGALSIEEAYVLDRLRALIETLGDVRDGLLSMRTGLIPRRIVAVPVHQDHIAVLLNGVRVCLTVAIICTLSVWSGLPGTVLTVLSAVIFVSLGSVLPDPRVLGNAALLMTPPVVLVAFLYAFFILPNIDGYPLFCLSLAPVVLAMCWLIKCGRGAMGLYFGVSTLLLISPDNIELLDPAAFVQTASFLAVGGIVIFLSFLIIIPVDPALRRLRIALGIGRDLRRALADEGHRRHPLVSLHYDRLSQFKSWQRDEAVSLARRNTMSHLSNMGNLAFAVRRSWRALDRARPIVELTLDARARAALPKLVSEDTLDVARSYLSAARERGSEEALALVRAAAGLYGVATLTTVENRLLGRLALLGRLI